MHGRLLKRKNTWYVILSLGRDHGKYKQRWISVKGNKDKAQKKLTELLYRAGEGRQLNPSAILFKDYLDWWLQEHQYLRFETRRRYREICQLHLAPAIGHISLKELNTEDLRQYFNNARNRMAVNTLRQHHAVLSHVLKDARIKHLITEDLLLDVAIPPRQKFNPETWTFEDAKRFQEYHKDNPLLTLYHLAMITGMRRSELFGLEWSDIDWYGNLLSVKMGYQDRGTYKEFLPPKSNTSRRSIDLPKETMRMLKDYHSKRDIKEPHIFWRDGRPVVTPNALSKQWQRDCEKAGVKIIRLHDSRHTMATLLLALGVNPKIVQERLGHSSISMTMDTYSHVMPGLQQQAAQSLEKMIAP